MLRPSAVAPKVRTVNAETCLVEQVCFTESQVQFHDNGILKLVFHGVKNGCHRDGFTVILAAACNRKG